MFPDLIKLLKLCKYSPRFSGARITEDSDISIQGYSIWSDNLCKGRVSFSFVALHPTEDVKDIVMIKEIWLLPVRNDFL